MRIAVSGSSGLIGSSLAKVLREQGHQVIPIVRTRPEDYDQSSSRIFYDLTTGEIMKERFNDLDAVIHLAGAGIADKRWTSSYKKILQESRVRSTRILAEAMAAVPRPPKVFIVASAIGFYGTYEYPAPVTEDSPRGRDFLATLCQAWEEATFPAYQKGVRVTHLRFGPVLTPRGGMLAKMLPFFRWGLGGRIGNGHQYLSWISLEEIPFIVDFLLQRNDLQGVFNAVAPSPVTNKVFAEVLAHVLRRPCRMSLPDWLVRLLGGEMAEVMLLKGVNVQPARLQKEGYVFRFPELEPTLRRLVK